MLIACRKVDVADDQHRLGAMSELGSVLTACCEPRLQKAAASRPDLLADAALRLWSLCAPSIAAADAAEDGSKERWRRCSFLAAHHQVYFYS